MDRIRKIAKGVAGAFVDQPAPWDDETQDKLEKERDEAEKKLRTQLKEVDGRYYWEPGRTVSYNMTLTGRPLAMEYRLGGMWGVTYRDGLLTINPQWVSARDSMPSYAWSQVVDKMVHQVKQSERISDMAEKTLDGVEAKLGFKIDPKARQDIVRWCEKAAERRLSVRAYPGPKGKEFVVAAPPAAVPATAGSRTAGTMASFEVRAERHDDAGGSTVETILVVHGQAALSAEGPVHDDKTYEECFDAVRKVIERASRKAPAKPTATKWGFDLMDFGPSRGAFQRVLSSVGISATKEPKRGHIGEFVWEGSGITIVTGNNPITGEYSVEGRRQPQPGYASYVGIEGSPDKVEMAAGLMKRLGDYKDESPNARDFI